MDRVRSLEELVCCCILQMQPNQNRSCNCRSKYTTVSSNKLGFPGLHLKQGWDKHWNWHSGLQAFKCYLHCLVPQSPKETGKGSCQLERQPEQVGLDTQWLRLWFRLSPARDKQPNLLPHSPICAEAER